MRLFSKLGLALAFAFATISAGNASAAVICNACTFQGDVATYIGLHNPATNDSSTYEHTSLGSGAFSDQWVFGLSGIGTGEVGATFQLSSNVSGFVIQLNSVTSGSCPVVGALPDACSSLTVGGLITNVDTNADGASVRATFTNLASGFYVFRISGTSSATGQLYSGNLITSPGVPEPLMLSLLGLGLAGLAVRRRRA